jgi:hypothetical protein
MRKKLYAILTVLAIGIITIMYFIYWLNQPGPYELKKRAQMTPDHQLLCEVLKPGMSEEEVLSALQQVGDFTIINRWDWGNEYRIELRIHFTDSELDDKYGTFHILFRDKKYMRAGKSYLVGDENNDPSDILCDFYQEPVFITDTP